jgi:hypothetical protein
LALWAAVTTAVLSDLHVGAVRKRSVATAPRSLELLGERLAGIDHLVLLGDVLELREAPLGDVLAAAEPLFRTLAEAAGGGLVTIVPGNHDHHLAQPLLEARRVDGAGPLPAESAIRAPSEGALGRIAGWLAPAEVRLAYPAVRLRPDVVATHGHYLDLHNAVPTLECLAVSAVERALGGAPAGGRTPDDYEAALAPLYALSFSLAQAGGRSRPLTGSVSAAVWRRTGGATDGPSLSGRLLAGAAVPAAVALANRAGLGPFRPDLTGRALRRSALAAMAEAAGALDATDEHLVFGHTHRSGPWPGDDGAEWALPGGGRLTNSGCWVADESFAPAGADPNPYSPGTCVFLDAEGPPRLERLLGPAPATRT